MEYSKLVSVTGLGGLYELLASKGDGAIVRSLDDKTTRFISSRVHNFSHLESIEVYTAGDNVNLVDVFHEMEKAGEPLPSEKDTTAVKKYFEKVYPDMDFERVYSSDMKKMVKWFDVLQKNNVEIKLTEGEPEEETHESDTEENNAAAISAEIGVDKEKEQKIQEEVPASKVKKESAPKSATTEEPKKKSTKK